MKIPTKTLIVTDINHAVMGKLASDRRKKLGMSQRTVAKAMGISIPYLSALETGNRNWSTKLTDKFAKATQPRRPRK